MKYTMEEFIEKIDFDLLKKQKSKLFDIMRDTDNIETIDLLEGLIILINNVQDIAVDEYGYNENEVFDLDNEV
jgi:hypothetical protein